jgi:hypothetical protein
VFLRVPLRACPSHSAPCRAAAGGATDGRITVIHFQTPVSSRCCSTRAGQCRPTTSSVRHAGSDIEITECRWTGGHACCPLTRHRRQHQHRVHLQIHFSLSSVPRNITLTPPPPPPLLPPPRPSPRPSPRHHHHPRCYHLVILARHGCHHHRRCNLPPLSIAAQLSAHCPTSPTRTRTNRTRLAHQLQVHSQLMLSYRSLLQNCIRRSKCQRFLPGGCWES